jgi:Fe-S cluster assembly protein SufD
VFVNGRFSPSHSQIGGVPQGCDFRSIAAKWAREPELVGRELFSDPKRGPFVALNTALFEDGAWIYVDRHSHIEQPIHLVFAASDAVTPFATHVRNVVIAGTRSRAKIVEHHVGGAHGAHVVSSVTELFVEDGAQLDHVLLQELGPGDLGFLNVFARQRCESRLRLQSLAFGASLARVEVDALLEEERAELELDGLYLGRGTQHQDHHTTIDHASPRTTSHELFKGILADRAHGVFHGRIHVRPDAQKIDASQTNRALLLSDGAVIDSKPQLEIYADDVKCSHGASIGQLDPDQIFYLRARGLDFERARALLTFAFASEVLAKLPIPALRESLEQHVLAWLGDAP